eukprot:g33659.t1
MKLALDLAVGEAAAPKEAGGAHQAPPVKLHLRHGTHQVGAEGIADDHAEDGIRYELHEFLREPFVVLGPSARRLQHATSAIESRDTPIAPVPGRRRSITSKAADVARRLVKPFGGGSHARPEEEVPLWALRLSHDVHELRHITENVVVAALGELMPQTSSEVRRRSLQPALIREEEDEDLDSSHSSSFRDPGSRPWTNPFEESSHSRGGQLDCNGLGL